MKVLRFLALFSLASLAACGQDLEANVNERYTVENVEVSGFDQAALGRNLRQEIHGLIGQKFSQQKLDEVSRLINKALPGHSVSVRITRGQLPEHIRVIFEIRSHEERFDLAAPTALYASESGWTGEVDATVQSHANFVTLGLVSDGDTLAERATGLRARYENRQIVVRVKAEERLFPAGSLRVDLDQPGARSAVMVLEPCLLYGIFGEKSFRGVAAPDGTLPVWRIGGSR